MSQVDFYLLQSSDPFEKSQFLCRLLEKIHRQGGHQVYIHCSNEQETHALDELLWTFKDTSFIPHNLYGEGPKQAPAIQFGFEIDPKSHRDVLINLDKTVPEFQSRFKRTLEIHSQLADQQALIQDHQAFYETQGHTIKTHAINTQQKKAEQNG
jgi:DNA polymerase III subunit chi